MKKLILILMLITSLNVSATSKDTLNAITMVSYEQSWLDHEGTLALKNNTNEYIHNFTYRIIYLDMNGKELDYNDLISYCEIAPGMTKKINIDAYENSRRYSYYLSEACYNNPHKFKIKFELTGYNTLSIENTKDILNPSLPFYTYIVPLVFVFLFVGTYIGLYVLVAFMAKRRKRNAALWVLVSIFATPLLAIIILLCIGEAYSQAFIKDDEQEFHNWNV